MTTRRYSRGGNAIATMVSRSLHKFYTIDHQAVLSSAMAVVDLVFLWLDKVCSGQCYLLLCYQYPRTKLSLIAMTCLG